MCEDLPEPSLSSSEKYHIGWKNKGAYYHPYLRLPYAKTSSGYSKYSRCKGGNEEK